MELNDRTVVASTVSERRRARPRAAYPMILVAVLSLTACGDDTGDSSFVDPDDTVPTTEGDLDEALRLCAERADEAKFTFQPNKQMTVGEPETVEAVATPRGVQPPDSLAGDEPTKTMSVSLACPRHHHAGARPALLRAIALKNPWRSRVERWRDSPALAVTVVLPLGFEPRTNGLRVHCSAIELEKQAA